MARSRFMALMAVAALGLAACGGDDGGTGPALTRALSPPIEEAPSTTITTTRALSPTEADRLTRTQLSSVLAASQELYAANGTFDSDISEVAALAPGVSVITLETAALDEGVVYDAHDQRLTLHSASASGRWFCVDSDDRGTDYGFGDSFQEALDTCTDGVFSDGWEDSFSAAGPDEAAIKAVLANLADALSAGDSAAAYATFAAASTCSRADLEAAWPPGLELLDPADFRLETVTIGGDRATASVSLGPLSDAAWPLIKQQGSWLHSKNPCDLVGPVAAEHMDVMAHDLMERSLFTVRSAFVLQSDFAFSPATLADLDGDLLLVPVSEVTFGTVTYTGSTGAGLLLTAGSPGRFYCAVESLTASTAYGEGETIEEVDSVRRCRAQATK